MAGTNPYAELQPAWEVCKCGLRNARQEMHRAYQEEQHALQSGRVMQAIDMQVESMRRWENAVMKAMGRDISIEWRSYGSTSSCIVNGIMLFS